MKGFAAAFITVALLAAPASARPVLVELFTSQGCSSCPPADALMAALQKSDKDILPLSFNVTYWNGPAWTDTDSLDAATTRQYWYAGLHQSDTVYTPEAVVDGDAQLVGSDRDAVVAAISAAKNAQSGNAPIALQAQAGKWMVSIGQGKTTQAGNRPETIWLFGFDRIHTTQIGGGENGGATLTEVNVVRSITTLGHWSGNAGTYMVAQTKGAHMAVVLQRDDGGIGGIAVE